MDPYYLPFLTRKMLVFNEQASFNLQILTASDKVTNVEVQGMTKDGIFRYNFQTDATSLVKTTLLALPDAPIWITVKTYEDDRGANDVYVLVYLMINGIKNMLLCQGNIGGLFGINWPNQSHFAPLQARGKDTAYEGTDPAPGQIPSITVPAGEYWKIKAIECTLRTDATVANRRPKLTITHANGLSIQNLSFADQTASKTITWTWTVGIINTNDTTGLNICQPMTSDLVLAPGSTIKIETTNLQAGDDWGKPKMFIEKYYSDLI